MTFLCSKRSKVLQIQFKGGTSTVCYRYSIVIKRLRAARVYRKLFANYTFRAKDFKVLLSINIDNINIERETTFSSLI